LSSKVVGKGGYEVVKALMEGNALNPTPRGYRLLRMELGRLRISPKMLISYWEKQSRQLDKMPAHGAGGFDVLTCRHMASERLSRLYGSSGMNEKASRWAAVAVAIREEATDMEDKWQGRLGSVHYPKVFFPRKNVPHPRRL
jgi:hypothetical protein